MGVGRGAEGGARVGGRGQWGCSVGAVGGRARLGAVGWWFDGGGAMAALGWWRGVPEGLASEVPGRSMEGPGGVVLVID